MHQIYELWIYDILYDYKNYSVHVFSLQHTFNAKYHAYKS